MKRGEIADVTVRICSYNRPEYLREALLSVLAQNRKPRFIEIFDNASAPTVYQAIDDLIRKNVSWMGARENVGGILNIQRAFYGVKTKYLYIMHDDDRILPDFLEEQITYLNKNKDCVAVSCNATYINEKGKPIAGQWLPKDTADRVFTSPRNLAIFYSAGFLGFPGFVYRASAIAAMKFRPALGKTCDVGLIIDLAKSGNIGFQNKVLLQYRTHSSQDSTYFSERTIKNLFDFLLSFLPADDPETPRIRTLYRVRLKNAFIANVRNGKSGWKVFFWICGLGDLELIFRIFAGILKSLLHKARLMVYEAKNA